MRVVIAGAGSVGRSIARELIRNGHTVLLIDREGRPSSRLSGTVSREALRDAIDALTGDRA